MNNTRFTVDGVVSAIDTFKRYIDKNSTFDDTHASVRRRADVVTASYTSPEGKFVVKVDMANAVVKATAAFAGVKYSLHADKDAIEENGIRPMDNPHWGVLDGAITELVSPKASL